MSCALVDPRPPPKHATKPRTTSLRSCEVCRETFVAKDAGRFCSLKCSHIGRRHPAEFVTLARQKWDAGQSSREIALWASEHLGRTITPNVILGISHRYNFAPAKIIRPSHAKRPLRNKVCGLCEKTLERVAKSGVCGAMWLPDDVSCFWVKTIAEHGAHGALTLSNQRQRERATHA